METPVHVQYRDVDPEPQIDRHINERIAKLDSQFARIIGCRVVVNGPPAHHRKGAPFEVDIEVFVPGKVLMVNRKTAPDIRVALTEAFHAMERQLEDHAQRIQAH